MILQHEVAWPSNRFEVGEPLRRDGTYRRETPKEPDFPGLLGPWRALA